MAAGVSPVTVIRDTVSCLCCKHLSHYRPCLLLLPLAYAVVRTRYIDVARGKGKAAGGAVVSLVAPACDIEVHLKEKPFWGVAS